MTLQEYLNNPVTPAFFGGIGLPLLLVGLPLLCDMLDRRRCADGARCRGQILALQTYDLDPDGDGPSTYYDFSYCYVAGGTEYRGQATWVDNSGGMGRYGSPPRIDAAVEVRYDPAHPQRSMPHPWDARASDGQALPTGLATPRLHPLQWIFIYIGLGSSGGMFWEGIISLKSALLLAAALLPTLAVVVTRCLFRDHVRSAGILWYTCVVGEVAAMWANLTGTGWTGLLPPLAMSLALNAAGLAWYLRAVRSSKVLSVPSRWKNAVVRSLHKGRKSHLWLSWQHIQGEVKIERGQFGFRVPALRAMVRAHRADAPGTFVSPMELEVANAGVISASDLMSADRLWLRSVPRVGELFERFPSAFIVVRPEALYVTVFVGLTSATDTLLVAEMAQEILQEVSSAPEALQGYRDGPKEPLGTLHQIEGRLVTEMPKRWEDF